MLGLAGVQERSELPLVLGPAPLARLLVQAQALLQSLKGRVPVQTQIWVLELEPELAGAWLHAGVQVQAPTLGQVRVPSEGPVQLEEPSLALAQVQVQVLELGQGPKLWLQAVGEQR